MHALACQPGQAKDGFNPDPLQSERLRGLNPEKCLSISQGKRDQISGRFDQSALRPIESEGFRGVVP